MIVPLAVVIMIIFLGMIVYYLCRWLLKRPVRDKEKRKGISIILAILLGPCLFFAIASLLMSLAFKPEKQRKFNRERWCAYPERRYEMRKSVVNRKMLIGMTMNDLIIFLDRPSSTDSLGHQWEYYLGVSGYSFGFRWNSLIIIFKNDKVAEVMTKELND